MRRVSKPPPRVDGACSAWVCPGDFTVMCLVRRVLHAFVVSVVDVVVGEGSVLGELVWCYSLPEMAVQGV